MAGLPGGFYRLPGSPQLCGAARGSAHPAQRHGGMQRGASVTFVPSPLALGAAFVCCSWLRVSLEGLRDALRVGSPCLVRGDPRLTMGALTVRTSHPVCSAEVVALGVLGVCHSPSEGPGRRTLSCRAAGGGSARLLWVDSCHRGSSHVRATGIAVLPSLGPEQLVSSPCECVGWSWWCSRCSSLGSITASTGLFSGPAWPMGCRGTGLGRGGCSVRAALKLVGRDSQAES